MADMMEYLKWRGDILFSQLGFNDVDGLIFSTLTYIRYDGLVPEDFSVMAPLRTVAKTILALPKPEERCRTEKDLQLLETVAQSDRFGRVGITGYKSVFIPEEETQFAAVTFVPEDGTAVLAFRGTDNTLVGWKEDFNMTFQRSIPAQRLAREYTQSFAQASKMPMRLCGHSKGGNLAVYAGAKAEAQVQDRIEDVINHDGPGFTETMLQDPGYLRIVPKIKTFVPQSSVFGLLLEREEPVNVIHSNAVGLLQHDPYSWSVCGKDFVPAEALTESSRFLDRTFKTWLAGLTNEERSTFFDGLFELLMLENAEQPKDIIRPQNILASLKSIYGDEAKRKMMGSVLQELMDSAKSHRTPQP